MSRYEQERLSSRQRGYDVQWDKASKLYRVEHPLCVGCHAIGIVEPATLVDHIEPHQGDRAKFWDEANWQSSCEWHHNAVKAALERLWFDGAIPHAYLRLDSKRAIALSKQIPRKAAIVSADGWLSG